MIYAQAPIVYQLKGCWRWFRKLFCSRVALVLGQHPVRWLNWLLGIAFFITMTLPVLGLLTLR